MCNLLVIARVKVDQQLVVARHAASAQLILVIYLRLTQPSIPPGKWNTGLRAKVKAGRIHQCRVADNTVFSYMTGDAPWL